MAITDIDISTELETNAPSIKYTGNEGPKSPQEEQMIMKQQMNEMDQIQNQEAGDEEMMMADSLLQEEYLKYVFEMEEQGLQPMSFRKFRDQIISEAQMSSAQTMAPRQMAAYGGIMGMDGRRQYGLGSKFKKFVRKIIPNEVAKVAEVAAPFVAMAAPQFALPAALAGGLGRFDRTGSIGDSLKSGLMTYGLGQLSPGLPGIRDMGPSTGMFSKTGAMGGKYNLSNMLAAKGRANQPEISGATGTDKRLFTEGQSTFGANDALGGEMLTGSEGILSSPKASKILTTQKDKFSLLDIPGKVKNALEAAGLGNNLMTGLLVGGLGAGALMDNMTEEEVQDTNRGEGLDVEAIRTEVLTAMKDPTGEALKAIRIKYPFLGTQRSKNVSGLAYGGRIGKAEGGLMDLGGMEKDYRAEGGFVPIGKAEKADDVPARLSVNEFVFTADAVRNAGGGDIDRGAEVMENMMKNLEQGGQVSEESQGMQGAQQMFETSQRLSEVM